MIKWVGGGVLAMTGEERVKFNHCPIPFCAPTHASWAGFSIYLQLIARADLEYNLTKQYYCLHLQNVYIPNVFCRMFRFYLVSRSINVS